MHKKKLSLKRVYILKKDVEEQYEDRWIIIEYNSCYTNTSSQCKRN